MWGQFRRWSHNGTLAHLQAGLHEHARLAAGRAYPKPSMVIIDTQLARGSSHGGETFHDRGGPYGATKGAKRIIAVDITGLALCGRVVPASTTESQVTELLVDDIMASGQGERLELILVDRGTSQRKADAISTKHSIEVRRLFHKERPVDPVTGKGIFVPLPYAWRVEVAHGQLGRSRQLSKSFENSVESATAWLLLGCISLILNDL